MDVWFTFPQHLLGVALLIVAASRALSFYMARVAFFRNTTLVITSTRSEEKQKTRE